MSDLMFLALIQFATRFGIDAAIALASAKPATIDEAISALQMAKTKTAEDYLAEERAKRVAQ